MPVICRRATLGTRLAAELEHSLTFVEVELARKQGFLHSPAPGQELGVRRHSPPELQSGHHPSLNRSANQAQREEDESQGHRCLVWGWAQISLSRPGAGVSGLEPAAGFLSQ